VQLNGRVGALLELGAGFHPEYSGRDNIALAAALYGLNAEETRARLPEIVAFADIGRYIDEPVKHYSSGMIVRLGFAIVASLRPDLLITDEVLAVGDESFQKKCVRWIEDYLGNGGTMILVSHSMYHVQKLCRSACWLREGSVAAIGDVFDVTQAYLAYQERKTTDEAPKRDAAAARAQEFHLLEYALNDTTSDIPLVLEQGARIHARVRVHSRDGREPVIGFGLGRADGTSVYGTNSEMDGVRPVRENATTYVAEIDFSGPPLLPGAYVLRAHALDSEGVRLFDTLVHSFTVRGESREFGLVRLTHAWNGAHAAIVPPVSVS
jgi:lipopolysaccharide transport system ATP-binding protein